MVKASEVIGRQITVRDGGHDIGRIKDLVVDPTGRDVIGIVLSDGMFAGSRVAPWKAVQAFGPDSVVIDVAGSVVKASAAPDIKAVLDKKTKIKGLKLLTTKGKELGKIVDFVFDETTGDGQRLRALQRSVLRYVRGQPFPAHSPMDRARQGRGLRRAGGRAHDQAERGGDQGCVQTLGQAE